MRVGRTTFILILCLTGGALTACGGGDDDSGSSSAPPKNLPDPQAIDRAIADYLQGFAEGDGKRTCSQLTANGQKALVDAAVPLLKALKRPVGDCEAAVADFVKALDENDGKEGIDAGKIHASLDAVGKLASDPDNVSARITGTSAVVTIKGAPRTPRAVKVDGRWLIDDLGQ